MRGTVWDSSLLVSSLREMMSVYSPSLPCSDPLDDEGLLHLEDEEDEEEEGGGFLISSGCGRGAEREGGIGYSQASGLVAGSSHSSSLNQPFDRIMRETGEGEDASLSSYAGVYGKNFQQIRAASQQAGPYLHQEEGRGTIIGRDDEDAYGSHSNGVYTPDKKTVLTSGQSPSANYYSNEGSSSPSTLLVGAKGSLYDEKKSIRGGGGVSLLSPATPPPASSSYRSQNNIGTKISSSFMKKSSGGAGGGRNSSFLDFDGGAPMQVITGYETLCMETLPSTSTTATEGRVKGGIVSTGISSASTSSVPPSEVYVHPRKGSSDKWNRDEGGHTFEEEKQSTADTAFLSSGGRGDEEEEEGLIDVSFASPQISPSSADKQRGSQSVQGSERNVSLGQSYQMPREEEEEHDEDGSHFFSSSCDSTSFSSSAKLAPPPVSSFPFDRSREEDDDKKSLPDGFRGVQGESETQKARMTFSSGNGRISPRDPSSASECTYTSTHSPSSPSPSFRGPNVRQVATEELEHIASQGGESERQTSLKSSSTHTISLLQTAGASKSSGFDRHSKSYPFRSPSPASCEEDPEYGYETQTGGNSRQQSSLLGGGDEEGKKEPQRSLLQKTSKTRGGEEGRQGKGFSILQKGGSFLPFSLSFGGGGGSFSSDSFSSSSSPSLVQWKEVLSIVANRLYYSKYTAYLYAFVFIVNAWVLVRCLTLSAVDLPVVIAEVFVTTMLLFEVLLRALVVVRKREKLQILLAKLLTDEREIRTTSLPCIYLLGDKCTASILD